MIFESACERIDPSLSLMGIAFRASVPACQMHAIVDVMGDVEMRFRNTSNDPLETSGAQLMI